MDAHKLKRALENGLTVEELIDELKTHDPKSKVAFAYNYGDYGRTQVAELVETVDENEVKWSEYCRMIAIVDDNGERSEESEDNTIVIINLKTG